MPSPLPHPPAAALTRRAALALSAVGAGALWAGCTTGRDRTPAARRRREAVDRVAGRDPDIAVAAAALAGERSALDALAAATARHPVLAPTLSPVLDAHRAHVRLLGEAVPENATPSPGTSDPAGPAPSEVPPTDPFQVPPGAGVALRRLAELEAELSTGNKRHAFSAQSGAFARLLASMAASAAQHAVVLGRTPATEPAGR